MRNYVKIAGKKHPLILEKHVQEYVVQYMTLDGWRSFKMEAVSDSGFIGRVMQKFRAQGFLLQYHGAIDKLLRSCMRAAGVGEPGMADYLFIRYEYGIEGKAVKELAELHMIPCPRSEETMRSYAGVLWIEFKRPGQKPRPEQLAWKEAEERRGALCWVIDSQDAFLERYRGSGLQRKAIS